MKKLQFKKDINASAERVYNTMLGLDHIETYEQWTSEFNPTSTYEGSWEKGSKIYFVGTDENGKKGGMVSEIADNVPSQFVSIHHYGILDGDQEITEGPEVEKWAGSLENYSFREHNGVTTVAVEIDVTEDYLEYFNTTWPKALDKLKELAEK
ncbi:Activator of Hsp90 ATPase homolog 1-like protein [Flagellimonas taeanensis]|uniref:Activator of Hsp90 ATPase homolog 1-like protein n=1 Tax=Flagellimonas taeanensis TaxID=1005926 RepID=A0A1M6RP05_9FLAO|nr:SRPBCC domain-containing protein [Allomuricauda taeanensis]SFB76174.1 Activator of Hsp90 ATPase homolog 1-like protein [Allomuricauda taeanensis]SHK34189.1 Activator of Hsp90 ATPase homolog 1-like protein [Allomuricauda taeanensis]